VKNNLQLTNETEPARIASQLVLDSLGADPIYRAAVWPRSSTPPRFNLYEEGMYYGEHLDAALMMNQMLRADVSITVFLNDPNEYDGGELLIDTGAGIRVVKMASGDCVAYGAGTRHSIARVTRGRRLVAVFWVQSLIRDPERRRLLFDLTSALEYLERHAEPGPYLTGLRTCQLNLLRLWAET
jgi:PKHD-type hydroxylase